MTSKPHQVFYSPPLSSQAEWIEMLCTFPVRCPFWDAMEFMEPSPLTSPYLPHLLDIMWIEPGLQVTTITSYNGWVSEHGVKPRLETI